MSPLLPTSRLFALLLPLPAASSLLLASSLLSLAGLLLLLVTVSLLSCLPLALPLLLPPALFASLLTLLEVTPSLLLELG